MNVWVIKLAWIFCWYNYNGRFKAFANDTIGLSVRYRKTKLRQNKVWMTETISRKMENFHLITSVQSYWHEQCQTILNGNITCQHCSYRLESFCASLNHLQIDRFPSSIELYSIRFDSILFDIFWFMLSFSHVLFYDISVYRIRSQRIQSAVWIDSEIQFILYNDIALKIWLLLKTHEHAIGKCVSGRARIHVCLFVRCILNKAIRLMVFVSTKMTAE